MEEKNNIFFGNNGILFPTGSNTTNDFTQLTRYLNSGYDAVKAVSPNSKVVTHLTHGAGIDHFEWFFSNFLTVQGGKTNASESDGAVCVQMEDDGSDNLRWYFLVTE